MNFVIDKSSFVEHQRHRTRSCHRIELASVISYAEQIEICLFGDFVSFVCLSAL